MNSLRRFWDGLTGKNLPSASSINDDPAHAHKLPTVEEDRAQLPYVWFGVMGMAAAGFVLNLFMPGGMVVWPFIFAVAVLLVVNDASDANGVGVPPLQAYGLFAGVLAALFLFVALVSRINVWLLFLLLAAAGAFVVRDWKKRRDKDREAQRRRAAGLCIRCCTPVGHELDDECSNCGLPSNLERLDLLRLARAIGMRGDPIKARKTLVGEKTLTRGELKIQQLQQRRASRFAPAAKVGGRKK